MTPLEATINMLKSNRYLTMATTDGTRPWAAPLAYVTDINLDLYYYSATASRHQTDILHNPVVALAIFNSTLSSDDVDGLQLVGRVTELQESELPDVISLYFRESFPDPEVRKRWERPVADFLAPTPQRFYKIELLAVYKLDLDETAVDKRITIDLDVLKKDWKK